VLRPPAADPGEDPGERRSAARDPEEPGEPVQLAETDGLIARLHGTRAPADRPAAG
jgi:hypothetical protein